MGGIIFNPGSNLAGGTHEEAMIIAQEFLCWIKNSFPDVDIVDPKGEVGEPGRWIFRYKHSVTGVVCELNTHGFTREEADKFIFYPRTYFNGSSTFDLNDPEHWLTPEYSCHYVFVKKSGEQNAGK